MPDFDDIKKMADEHDDQVDAGSRRPATWPSRNSAIGEQIDQVVEKAQNATGSDDQQ